MAVPSHREQGFTLTELIMTMVIIGILAATLLPRWFQVSTFRERGFYDEVKAAVRYAQKSALAANCPVAVTVVANTSYSASYTAACTGGPLPVQGFNGGALGGAPPAGVTLSSDTPIITFDGAGRTVARAVITIGTRTLTIHAGTGYVEAI